MKNTILIVLAAFLFRLLLIAGVPDSLDNWDAEDSTRVAKGESLFNQNCTGCHSFRQDGIGPNLGGLTAKVSPSWIERFIKNPQKTIKAGDKRGQQLLKKYKVVMPSFALKEDEMKSVLAFLSTKKLVSEPVTKGNGNALTNPIPEPIKVSNLVGTIEAITTIPPSSTGGQLPLTRITKIGLQPANENLFILDLRGKLYQLRNGQPEVYINMEQLRPNFIHKPGLATGFGSFAFHPDFNKNGLLYTTHSEPARTAKADFAYADSIKVALQWVLTEWKADNPADPTFTGKGRELLRVNMVSVIHGVQEITFNPLAKAGSEDYGLLYIGVGEGGCVENGFPFLAHNKQTVWGTVLRIDPAGTNSANKQYGIPKQNPFAQSQNQSVLKEIYAYGFRNPHRITWTHSGKMLVSNVGHANVESVNLVEPGHDYGWPIREGTFLIDPYGNLNKVFPLPLNDNAVNVTYPVAQFDHDEGNAISGGFEYTGSAVPQLKGKFLFGDIPSGRLFYFDVADIKQGKQATIKEWKMTINGAAKTFREVCGSNRVDLHFGKDSKDELYLLTKADGKVYKLTGAEIKK
ncbi:PQQ-dependent sugar dehydrogenase [Segetibacter aerophilus]|uniref:Dehydrogenase n=1 Tax=Segetibacter aerophilus TaxID=670293 RepID=A0A512BB66_9BACT|nr:PQQ-dependent sugar dehydrogenase [Segetibacter aerophilus]GEO09067.1 dehydrogenase [Segetibacter aerophilus]